MITLRIFVMRENRERDYHKNICNERDRICIFVWFFFQLLQVFDSCAGELGPYQFNKFALPFLREIAYGVREKLHDQQVEMVPMVCISEIL